MQAQKTKLRTKKSRCEDNFFVLRSNIAVINLDLISTTDEGKILHEIPVSSNLTGFLVLPNH